MIIVDTSVLIDFLSGRKTPEADYLAKLEFDEIPFSIPVICAQEVLQGARTREEWDDLQELLSTQTLLTPQNPWSTHRDAALIYFDGRRKGMTVRSTIDCFVAQLALENKGTLLHADRDYEQIARIRPLDTVKLKKRTI